MAGFDYRVAFVTGGASGIGLALAGAFSDLGAAVVIADSNRSYLAEASELAAFRGRPMEFLLLDVTDRTAMASAREEVRARFGAVDLLCNNAGVVGRVSVEEAAYDDWDRILDVNVGGVINGLVTFLPDMKAARRGHVVNTASMAALLPSGSGSGLYGTSKHAVRALTESLRLSVARYGVGVSLLCPGMVATRILQSSARDRHPSGGELPVPPLEPDAMDPAEVAAQVVAGVRSNAPYIVTHAGFRDEVAAYHQEILAPVPHGAPAAGQFHTERRSRLSEARMQANGLAR